MRLVVDRDGDADVMTLQVESLGCDTAAIEETLRDVVKLRGSVAQVNPRSLPNDGKVIDDIRKFD